MFNSFNSHLADWSFSDSDSLLAFFASALNVVPTEIFIVGFLCIVICVFGHFYRLIIEIQGGYMFVFLFNLIERQNFSNFISDVYNGTVIVLNKSVSLWGYTFTWFDMLRFSLLTVLLCCCLRFIYGGISLNDE